MAVKQNEIFLLKITSINDISKYAILQGNLVTTRQYLRDVSLKM